MVATQNPIKMEGTYPLPEAQLDRFMFNLKVKYPTIKEEMLIVKGTTGTHTAKAHPVLKADELLRLQDLVRGVPIADSVMGYAVRPGRRVSAGRVKRDQGNPQVSALWSEPAGIAVPGAGRQGSGDPRGQISR